MTLLPIAVCALIIDMEGKALLISRRNHPDQWGMPGGKADEGEDPRSAVIREVWEETGLQMEYGKLEQIYRTICPGEVDYDCITYFYDLPGPDLSTMTAEKGLHLKYDDFDTAMDLNQSPFAMYNKGVYIAFANRLLKMFSGEYEEYLRTHPESK